MNYRYILTTLIIIFSVISCTKEVTGDTGLNLRMEGLHEDGEYLTVLVFGTDGIMAESGKYRRNDDGTYGIKTSVRTGSILAVSGTGILSDYNEGMSLDEILGRTVSAPHGQMAELFYTAQTDIRDAVSGTLSLNAVYGVAKLGIRTVDEHTYVTGITVHGAADKGYIFPKETASTPEGVSRSDISVNFDTPFQGEKTDAAILFEQVSPGLSITVNAIVDGRETVLTEDLPDEIRRNNIYYVNLVTGNEPGISISVEEWSDGGSTGLYPDFDSILAIDKDNSDLPSGIQISDDGRTLLLPHLGSEMTINIDSPSELELLPFNNPMMEVSKAEGYNNFKITKRLAAPGVGEERATLKFRRIGLDNSYPEDTIGVILSGNPVVSGGNLDFNNADYSHHFDRYVDNELEVFSVPQGKEIVVEFEDGEDPWLKCDRTDEGFRLVAGWRPNDPTADGRIQEATIVIRNSADGSEREEYTVSRLNYGLPVAWLNGTWWCKYNAVGNSRSFEDQILCSEDPAALAGKTVFDYLRDCSAEEFYNLWGWGYQGDSGQGMKVIDQDGKAVMEGFTANVSVHMNKLDPKALSPDGYEIPSMEDFNTVFDATATVWLMWSGSHQLKTPWEGHSIIKREQRRRNDIIVGSLNLSDLIYISMYNPDYSDREAVVWYGPAAQWDANGILHSNHYNNILFAVYSPTGNGWYFSGSMGGLYLRQNGAGNKDTRIIRFKKSPVEYIY